MRGAKIGEAVSTNFEKVRSARRRCVAFAEGLAHPFSLALALAYLAMLHHFRQNPHAAEEHAVRHLRIKLP